jgi:hypothetical protein
MAATGSAPARTNMAFTYASPGRLLQRPAKREMFEALTQPRFTMRAATRSNRDAVAGLPVLQYPETPETISASCFPPLRQRIPALPGRQTGRARAAFVFILSRLWIAH